MIQYPSLPRQRLPNTSRATSEGNSMIEAAEETVVRDETRVKTNTATAPAPHLPVPVAALNRGNLSRLFRSPPANRFRRRKKGAEKKPASVLLGAVVTSALTFGWGRGGKAGAERQSRR